MYQLAIIGVGALGKRHLESVLKSEIPIKVYVVDNNKETVDEAVALSGGRATGLTEVGLLPKILDIVIIATSSAVRRMVFEELTGHCRVQNIVFEKVLFQRMEDYFAVEKELEQQEIRAWVNCARREYDSYRELKKAVDKCSRFSLWVAGGDWGLGCNGIHMLDLIEYFGGIGKCEITNVNLVPVVEESKRKGYKEIFGTVAGICGKCEAFSITCFQGSTLPMKIGISGDNFQCVISEGEKKIQVMRAENSWEIEEKGFLINYQSELTQKVVESILENGTCRLPDYRQAMNLHLKYIKPLISFFEDQGEERGLCPIT